MVSWLSCQNAQHTPPQKTFELVGRGNAHRVERKNTTRTTVYLKLLLEAFLLMLKPERLANVILELIMK